MADTTVEMPVGLDWILEEIERRVQAGVISAQDANSWLRILAAATGYVPIGAIQYQPGTPEWRSAVLRAYETGQGLIPTLDYYRQQLAQYQVETDRLATLASAYAQQGRDAIAAGELELGVMQLQQAAAIENARLGLQAQIANLEAATRLETARIEAQSRGHTALASLLGTLAGVQSQYAELGLRRAQMLAELAANPTNWVAEAYVMRGGTPPGVTPSAWQEAMSSLLNWQGAPSWLQDFINQATPKVLAGPQVGSGAAGLPMVSAPSVPVPERPDWLERVWRNVERPLPDWATERAPQVPQQPAYQPLPGSALTRSSHGFWLTPEGYIANPQTGQAITFEILNPDWTTRRQPLKPEEFSWLWQNMPGGFWEVK
jgi:hypothetical protein